jgi:hypothetical protein
MKQNTCKDEEFVPYGVGITTDWPELDSPKEQKLPLLVSEGHVLVIPLPTLPYV